jgi:hypothetical protein
MPQPTNTPPSADDPIAQLAAAEAADAAAAGRYPTHTAPPARNPPAPVGDDPLSQLAAAEQADKQGLQQIVGEHAVAQEQAGYDAQLRQAGFTYSTTDKLKDIASDVGHRILEIPEGVYSGVVHAAGEIASSTAEVLANMAPGSSLLQTAAYFSDPQSTLAKLEGAREGLVTAAGEAPRKVADAITPDLDTVGGQLTKGVTQFVAGFLPIARAARVEQWASSGARFAGNALAGGAAQALVFDPHDPRLSNLIQQHPALANPVTDFLASKPGDTEAEGRLKNFLEGTTLSAAGDAVIEGFTSVLKGMRATASAAQGTKDIAEAVSTPVDHPSPQPATAEPVQVGPDEVKPYEPPTLAKADTAEPVQSPAQEPAVSETEKDTSPPATAAAPQTFDPAAVARTAVSVPADKSDAVLQALKDGRYNAVPGLLDDTHRTIPWDTLSDGANLKGLFNAVEDTMGDLIRQAHGAGTVSDETITQLAKDIGGDVNSLAKTYGDLKSNGGLAARITAGYNIMVASARRLKDLATAAHALNPETDAGKQAILDFQKQLELHAAVVGQVRQSSAEIGRALYAHRALKASSDVALQNISELTGTVLGPKAVRKFVESVGNSDNLADITKAADSVRGKGFAGVIKEIAQNGMLSGIPTQLANIAGNSVNAVVKVAERYLAGVIGNIRGVLMPDAEVATVRAAVAHTAGAISGVRDSFPLLLRALTTEQSVSAAGRPIVRAIYKDPTGLTGAQLTLAQVINRVGQVVRYPGRFMGAIDNLNMGIGRQADLNARVYTQAAREADAKALTGDARDAFLDSRMAELRANPPPEVMEKSMDAGLYQSFQEAARTRFGDKITSALNSHPVMKLIVAPFVHRPLNMLRQSVMDYTPIGLLSANQRALLRAGNADTDVALARMVIGTGAVLASYELAANGYSTGAREGYRNTESLDQIPQHSVRIGERWYRYDRIDPVGMWLAIGAELHEAVQRHYPNNPDAVNDLGTLTRAAIQTVGQVSLEKSFMKSVDQLMQAMGSKDPKRGDILFEQLLASNATKLVPFSGALRGAAQAEDPTRRAIGGDSYTSIWDAVKAGLPGLSKDLPPRRDLLGRPIVNPAGDTSWWNPFAGSKASSDPLDRELSKLAINVQVPSRSLEGYTLDPQQYDELIRRSTQAPVFPGGTTLEGYLRALTQSDMWRSFDSTSDHGVMARTKMVQQAVDAAYQYGRDEFIQAHPDFLMAMQQRAMEQAAKLTRQ